MSQIDVNLEIDHQRQVLCRHCGTRTGSTDSPFESAIRSERAPQQAGPGIRVDPSVFTDRPIVLRQVFCPGCLTVLLTEVVPSDESGHRGWRIP